MAIVSYGLVAKSTLITVGLLAFNYSFAIYRSKAYIYVENQTESAFSVKMNHTEISDHSSSSFKIIYPYSHQGETNGTITVDTRRYDYSSYDSVPSSDEYDVHIEYSGKISTEVFNLYSSIEISDSVNSICDINIIQTQQCDNGNLWSDILYSGIGHNLMQGVQMIIKNTSNRPNDLKCIFKGGNHQTDCGNNSNTTVIIKRR